MTTEADAGTTRRYAVNQPIRVELDAQPGTGFGWTVEPDPGITQVGPPVVIREAGRPGGYEVQVFTFRAVLPGVRRIRFHYSQPWRGGTKDAKLLTYTFDIR